MRKPDFITAQEAVDRIESNTTICTIGMTLVSACETILKELENRFLETGHVDSPTENQVLFTEWHMKDLQNGLLVDTGDFVRR